MSESRFRDHFSGHASAYSRYRPQYPQELFQWLASLAPSRVRAWDCATGNGQAAVALAQLFEEVVATDASAEQLAVARVHTRVRYHQRTASKSGLADHDVDLVTIAQAMHWFDPAPFHRELTRVVRPGGILAAWCYELFSVDPAFDTVMLELYHDILGEDWPPQRRHVDTGYREISWPWPRMDTPPFEMACAWSLEQTLGYIRTWSASQRWRAREGSDPIALVAARLTEAWGTARTRSVRWPLKLLVSRLSGDAPGSL
ncbi:MAG: class I SAM-dependent methyltransferase [Myxococcota bacterium]|jgi:ubiquinone/menaquinone biosynthesis C-methylase UbiE|nr:class I SAM-dependent methyltransferase [Myxococcota bacterium]